MILSVDPEDGDHRYVVVVGHLIGKLDRRERFEQRVQRTAEQARLLAGHDGHRSRIREPLSGVEGAGRRLAATLLRRDDAGDRRALAAPSLRAGDGGRP